jgi:holo-[acyl-carrier protein] synthase
MTQHIGVDIVEIGRIEKAVARWGNAFLRRMFTPQEIETYGHKTQSLAARFAAKEAVSKARERADSLGLDSLAVSLAHSREHAIAFVSGQSKK